MINIKHLGRPALSGLSALTNQVKTDILKLLQVKWVSVSGFTFVFQFVVPRCGKLILTKSKCALTQETLGKVFICIKNILLNDLSFLSHLSLLLYIFTGCYSSDVVSRISSTDLDLGVESLEQMIKLITANFYNGILVRYNCVDFKIKKLKNNWEGRDFTLGLN